MDRFPTELLYIVLVVAFVLFNLLTQLIARRRARSAQQGAPGVPEEEGVVLRQDAPPPTAPPAEGFGRTQRRPAHVPRAEAAIDRTWPVEPAPTTATQGHRHTAARALLGNRRDLRRAIVVMTVLGPCRSLEASERR